MMRTPLLSFRAKPRNLHEAQQWRCAKANTCLNRETLRESLRVDPSPTAQDVRKKTTEGAWKALNG
jgi:hypothetical protein